MLFEITNREEYVTLKTCISLYEMMSWVVKENNDKIVEQTIKTFLNLLTIKLEKVQKFLNLKLKMKNSILMSLQVTFNTAITIQEEIQQAFETENHNFRKALELTKNFCQGYQEVYKDWTNSIQYCGNLFLDDLEEEQILARKLS